MWSVLQAIFAARGAYVCAVAAAAAAGALGALIWVIVNERPQTQVEHSWFRHSSTDNEVTVLSDTSRFVAEARRLFPAAPLLIAGVSARLRTERAMKRYVRALQYQAARRRAAGKAAWTTARAIVVLPGFAWWASGAAAPLRDVRPTLGVYVVAVAGRPKQHMEQRVAQVLGVPYPSLT